MTDAAYPSGMKLSARTISAFGKVVTGDEPVTQYRSGPKLVSLFNDFGGDDVYGKGFPSRWQFAEDHIRRLNGAPALAALICHVLDPREFMDTEFEVENALEFINPRLFYDGYEVIIENGLAKVRDLQGAAVECRHPFGGSENDGHAFIDEQIRKAEHKIRDSDYDGAITNARSLVEAVLKSIEDELDDDPPKYDGDLTKLFRRVQKLLNLEPGKPNLDASLRQTLSGLTSIINGLSALSNQLGDRHVRRYKPDKRHALLVVNSAKSIVSFLFDTKQFQAS